jgi:hypothetical protein
MPVRPGFFTCISGIHVDHFVKLHVFTFLVPCYDVSYSFRANIMQKFEDTKGIISRKSTKKTDYSMAKRERTKGQTTIYKTLHRKH